MPTLMKSLMVCHLAIGEEFTVGKPYIDGIREQEHMAPGVNPDAAKCVRIDLSSSASPRAVPAVFDEASTRDQVIARLEELLAGLAEETVDAVNHDQILRVIRAGREDC